MVEGGAFPAMAADIDFLFLWSQIYGPARYRRAVANQELLEAMSPQVAVGFWGL